MSQDAGTLAGVIGEAQVVDSGGFGAGSTQWVTQNVTSTFTGLISSFSIVAKSYDYIGSTVPLLASLWNNNNSDAGNASVSYGNICNYSNHDISVTSTECIVTFNLDYPVHVTSGNVITMHLNTNKQFGSNLTSYLASTQARDPATWISSQVHLQNSGAGQTWNWDTAGGAYSGRQLAWAWNLTTSTAPDPCTVNCNSNILFLPGMQGSRLYSESEKLWEPTNDEDVQDLYLDSTGTSTRSDIYTTEAIDEFYVGVFPTANIYKTFLEDLDDWKNASSSNLIADYAAIPYDWRLSLNDILTYGNATSNRIYYSGTERSTSTPYIIEQLRTLAQSSRTGKVTIIAHSYGGIVAKALMKFLQDSSDPELSSLVSKIDNLVLVGVPQTGTPRAIGGGLHGDELGIPDDYFSLFSLETGRTFASTSPMFYNLLPAENYFTDSGAGSYVATPPVTFVAGSSTQIFIDEYGTSIDGTSEFYNFLLGSEGRIQPASSNLDEPSLLDPALLLSAESVHFDLDTWTAPTTTHVYQIAGWGWPTISGIEYETDWWGDLKYTPQLTDVDGDGVVVTPSALAMSTSTSNVERFWIDLGSIADESMFDIDRQHHDIFEIPQLRNFLKDNIITHSTTTPPEFITVDQPVANPGDDRLYFFLHSPLKLSALDAYGHEISSTTSTLKGGIYDRFGEVQYVSVPASSNPTVVLTGYDSGSFTFDVKETKDGQIIATTTFSNIPSVTSTRANMSFPDGRITNATPLKIDQDGNGRVDMNLIPKINGIVTTEALKPKERGL